MKTAPKIVLIAFITSLVFSACEKKSCGEPVPQMSFAQFTPAPNDTLNYVLTFNFSDCDGDVGMTPTATIVDENGETQNNNFMIDLYHIVNGQWVKHDFGNAVGLDSKIPELNNSSANPMLDGEIEKKLHPDLSLLGYDSVKFKSRILDNAGHYSNEVETPGFIIK